MKLGQQIGVGRVMKEIDETPGEWLERVAAAEREQSEQHEEQEQ